MPKSSRAALPQSTRPLEGGNRLSLAGTLARITRVNGKVRGKKKAASQRTQHRMRGAQGSQQRIKVMGLRNEQPEFFHQGFQILFVTLLPVKTDAVMNGKLASAALLGPYVSLLGLLDPFFG